MSVAAFVGYSLIAVGPQVVIILSCIVGKPFLVLLGLASSFYWLIVLITISSIFRAFAPLSPTVGSYAILLLVAVLVEELARLGLWSVQCRLNRALLKHLDEHTVHRHRSETKFSTIDYFSISLTHGISHSIIHTLFFSQSWLPYALGGATLYNSKCPSMNYFMVSSLNSLGMAATLVPAMVIFFNAMMANAERKFSFLPLTMHLTAACGTLINFKQGGCLIATPLLLLLGLCCTVFSISLWWQRTVNTSTELEQR